MQRRDGGPLTAHPEVRVGYRPHVVAGWVDASAPEALARTATDVIDAATDFAWLARGDRVLVKVAANSGNPFPATTSPQALFVLVRHLYARGAGEVLVGDQSGVWSVHHTRTARHGSTRALMRSTGLWRAAEEAGAMPIAFEELGYDGYVADRVPGDGHWRGDVWVTRVITEVDHIVYLPRVSHHMLAFASLGQKIGVGWLREDSRLELHRDADSFAEKFEEVNRLPLIASRLRLVVTDGTAVQATFGPDWGHVVRPTVGLVFASTDLVAHEIIAHRWLAWTRAHATSPTSPHWLLDRLHRRAAVTNRIFVSMAWGLREGARTRRLMSPPVVLPLDDPALAQASRARGGAPEALAVEWVGTTRGSDAASWYLMYPAESTRAA
jgi:uncharacterized protein (DUF362 family)